MSLSCSCDADGDWWYYPPEDYQRLETKRWRKCCSCGSRISAGDLCLEFTRHRSTDDGSIEQRICGDEVSLASYWMCEACGDQYFNLDALGFCITLPGSMKSLLAEYVEVYGRKTA